MHDTLFLQEVDLLQKASRCIEYIQESLESRDYETVSIEVAELQFLARQLHEIEIKKARRAQLFEIVSDMRKLGIKIDFVSRMLG